MPSLHNLSEFVSGRHRFGCQEYLTAVAVGKEEKDPPVREHFIEGLLAAVAGRESLGFCPVLGIPSPPTQRRGSTSLQQVIRGVMDHMRSLLG